MSKKESKEIDALSDASRMRVEKLNEEVEQSSKRFMEIVMELNSIL